MKTKMRMKIKIKINNLTSKSIRFLKKFYSSVLNCRRKYLLYDQPIVDANVINKKQIISDKETMTQLKNIFLENDSSFISHDIKDKINSPSYRKCYCIKSLDGIKFIIYYFSNTNIDKTNATTEIKEIKNIYWRIYFILSLYPSRIEKEYGNDIVPTFYICPTNIKKEIKSDTVILGPENVNSGLTYTEKGIVLLWRREELYKVLVHELIHLLHIDKNIYMTNIVNNHVYQQFCILPSTEININEIYTESLAMMFDSALNICEKHPTINTNVSYNIFLNQIHDNRLHSLIQASKILHLYKYSSINQIIKKNIKPQNRDNSQNGKSIICKKNFEQNSNIFSYYILKSAFFYNMDYFISFLVKDTVKHKFINYNLNDLIDIINRSITNDYIKEIDRLIKIYNRMNRVNRNDNLRMTI